jgi:hypothetical protein
LSNVRNQNVEIIYKTENDRWLKMIKPRDQCSASRWYVFCNLLQGKCAVTRVVQNLCNFQQVVGMSVLSSQQCLHATSLIFLNNKKVLMTHFSCRNLCQRLLAITVFATLSLSTHATIVTHNGYSLNTETNIVTGGGLEWLQWDETLNNSINGVDRTQAGGGWGIASNQQMKELFDAFFPPDPYPIWDATEGTDQSISIAWDSEELSPLRDFTSVFGDTWRRACEIRGDNTKNCNKDGVEPRSISNAFFGSDLDSDPRFDRARVEEDYTLDAGPRVVGSVAIHGNFIDPGSSAFRAGVALVRSPLTPVPAPPALILFAFGLAGLGLTKRRIGKAQA